MGKASKHPVERPPIRSLWPSCGVALVLALGTGCEKAPPLPPPGAQGPIIIHQWESDGKEPLVVVATSVSHHGSGFQDLELQPVLIRLPLANGVLFIASPHANYAELTDAKTVHLQGPLKISGEYDGDPLLGRAAEAVFTNDKDGARLELTKLEMCVGGQLETHERVQVYKDRVLRFPGRNRRDAPPAAIKAAVMALPQPLAFPELKRGDFADTK